ncbi:MAG TPA: VOC family protein [Gemmatimonadales bacterium]|jgi:hypothetical protein|nr:VOC family protein [Gemmatimonadales bacterium]HEV8600240.1 VOC family protein [Gemmatimonadales bacterium]
MPTIEKHTPGTFCWWELATRDLGVAWRFYHALFRWEKRDVPIGEGQLYRICVLEGQDVAAMYQLDRTQLEHNVASTWLPYIAVKSADEAAQQAVAAGGTLSLSPFDVFDSGRMAQLTDSEGARVALWEPRQHRGAGIIREIGTVCWMELSAKDAERARRFYADAFGWKPERKSLGPAGEYTYWHVVGESKAFGGMLQMTTDWGDLSPAWMTYFQVADCDEIAAAARSAGGKVVMGPFDAANVGRIAVVTDPIGAVFSIIRFVSSER